MEAKCSICNKKLHDGSELSSYHIGFGDYEACHAKCLEEHPEYETKYKDCWLV